MNLLYKLLMLMSVSFHRLIRAQSPCVSSAGELQVALSDESGTITICGGEVDLFDDKTFEISSSMDFNCDPSQQKECVFNGGCIFDKQTMLCKAGGRKTFTNPLFTISGQYVTFKSISFKNGGNIDGYGGAIHVNNNDTDLRVDHCKFDRNTAKMGGAIYLKDGELDIKDSEFIGNVAGNIDGYGGAIHVNHVDADLRVDHCKFDRNTAKMGGAIYLKDGELDIKDSEFIGNVALGDGGALFIDSYSKNAIKSMYTNTFTKNIALGNGGAVAIKTSAGSFTEADHINFNYNKFFGNTAGESGGGMSVDVKIISSLFFGIIENEFVSNSAGLNGGGASIILNMGDFAGWYEDYDYAHDYADVQYDLWENSFISNFAEQNGGAYSMVLNNATFEDDSKFSFYSYEDSSKFIANSIGDSEDNKGIAIFSECKNCHFEKTEQAAFQFYFNPPCFYNNIGNGFSQNKATVYFLGYESIGDDYDYPETFSIELKNVRGSNNGYNLPVCGTNVPIVSKNIDGSNDCVGYSDERYADYFLTCGYTEMPSSVPSVPSTAFPAANSSPSSVPSAIPSSTPSSIPSSTPSLTPSSGPIVVIQQDFCGTTCLNNADLNNATNLIKVYEDSLGDNSGAQVELENAGNCGQCDNTDRRRLESAASMVVNIKITGLNSSLTSSDVVTSIKENEDAIKAVIQNDQYIQGLGSYSADFDSIKAVTNSPTFTPSFIPSSTPSSIPSSRPSLTPSSVPSVEPSSKPSLVPSSSPSSVPSAIPSSTPSSIPSSIPSLTPSSVPSVEPSSKPSLVPSSSPSSVPSAIPSSTPSSIPSSIPSLTPSSVPSGAPSSNPSLFPSSLPSTVPSINDFMYIVNITDISDTKNSRKWRPKIKISIANRNAAAGGDNYQLDQTKVKGTYQKGTGTKSVTIGCNIDSQGFCILTSRFPVKHLFINSGTGADSAEFNVISIDNPVSEYNAQFNKVDTTLVVWDPVATSTYPSLVPSTTSSPSRAIFPSSSPSLDNAMFLKNISVVTELLVEGWIATFELTIDNINPNAAGTKYYLKGSKVKVQYNYGKKKKKKNLTVDADGTCKFTTPFLVSSSIPKKGIATVDLEVLKITNKESTWKPGIFDEVGLTKIAWDPGYVSDSPSESA